MGPLSGKQHREYLKFQNKEAREAAKMELDEKRKQQLHEIKLQEAAAKANQGLGHKEQINNAKLKGMDMPSPKMNKQKLGIPSQNPLAGTGMFKQGQRSLPQPMFQAQGTDTVPAMLTPGEAVIPAPAAQNPKNKKAIKLMVQEGRKANRLRDGAVDVRYSDAPGQARYHSQGTDMVVPSLAYQHPDVPASSFEDGTEHVFSRGSSDMQHYNNGTYGVVPQQVQQAAGYNNGTIGASTSDIDTQTENDRRMLARSGASMFKLPAAAADVFVGAPVNALSNITTEAANWIGVPRMGRALGIYDNTVKSVELPKIGSGSLTPYMDIVDKSISNNQPVTSVSPTPVKTVPVPSQKPNPNITAEVLQRTKVPSSIEDMDTYDLFVKAESNGLLNAENKSSSAKGLVQITKGTWEGDSKKGTGLRNQVPELADIKHGSPEFYKEENQRLGFNHLNKQNEAILAKGKLPATNLNKYVMWGLGSVDGPKVLSNPNGNFKETLVDSETVLKANPHFANFKTNQDYINWAESYLNKKAGTGAGAGQGQRTEPRVTPAEQTNVAPDAVPQPSVAVPEKVLEVPPVEGTGFFQKQSQDKFNMLGRESQKEADKVSEAVQNAIKSGGTKEEQQGFLAKTLEGIFGPKGLFSDKELVRFGIVAAGGLLTGGSVGGSLRAAGLSTLQASDKRHAEEFAAEKQRQAFEQQDKLQQQRFTENERLTSIRANASASKDRFYQASKRNIDSAESEGLITPAVARQLHNQAAAGNFLAVEKVLGSTDYATPHYLHGLPKDAKPVNVLEYGFTTPRKAFYNENKNEYIFFDTDSSGKTVTSARSANDFQQIGSGDTRSQRLQSFKTDLLSNTLFSRDPKTNKGLYFDIGANDVMAQLEEWSSEQKRNKQKDDYSAPELANTVNNALRVAAQSGDRKPNIAKYLSLGLINTKALADPEIINGKDGKTLKSSEVGSIISDIKEVNIKDKEGNRISPTVFMDNVSNSYYAQKDNKLSPDQLAELVRNKTSDKLYNKIKAAPNPYWAYMYYQVALSQPKK